MKIGEKVYVPYNTYMEIKSKYDALKERYDSLKQTVSDLYFNIDETDAEVKKFVIPDGSGKTFFCGERNMYVSGVYCKHYCFMKDECVCSDKVQAE